VSGVGLRGTLGAAAKRLMIAFKHILVPTDFGASAAQALDFAIALAAKFGSKITLLHVSWLPPPAYAAYAAGLEIPTAEMEQGAKRELDRLLARIKDRTSNVEGVVVTGEPWRAILEVADQRSADAIVMGTHGYRGMSRFLLGSIAEKVVRLSPIPVVTVRGTEDNAP
jgi:nucleotide-binding universal stress UspA family protein